MRTYVYYIIILHARKSVFFVLLRRSRRLFFFACEHACEYVKAAVRECLACLFVNRSGWRRLNHAKLRSKRAVFAIFTVLMSNSTLLSRSRRYGAILSLSRSRVRAIARAIT